MMTINCSFDLTDLAPTHGELSRKRGKTAHYADRAACRSNRSVPRPRRCHRDKCRVTHRHQTLPRDHRSAVLHLNVSFVILSPFLPLVVCLLPSFPVAVLSVVVIYDIHLLLPFLPTLSFLVAEFSSCQIFRCRFLRCQFFRCPYF